MAVEDKTAPEDFNEPGSHKKIQTESANMITKVEVQKPILRMESESLPLKSTIDSDRKELSTEHLKI